MNVSQSREAAHQHCARGKGARSTATGARGSIRRLGLDRLDVVGAVRGRLVLGLLVLHRIDHLIISRRDRRARDGAGGERRRLPAGRARAGEDEERLGDELCEGSEIPGVSVTVDRQSLEARGFSIRRSRRWLRDVDRRR